MNNVQANGFLLPKPQSLEDTVRSLLYVSGTYCVVGMGGLLAGILTAVYASPDLEWPVSSFSGIWAPLTALSTGVIGADCFLRNDFTSDLVTRRRRCMVITFWTLVITCNTVGTLHIVYSCMGFSFCHTLDYDLCKLWESARPLLIAEGFNIAFGLCICVLSVCSTIYIATGKRLTRLSGMPVSGTTNTCCSCYVGEIVVG